MIPVLTSPDAPRVEIALDAVCHTCQHRHKIRTSPKGFTQALWDWATKHPVDRGHLFEFLTPFRRLPPKFDDRVYEQAGHPPWWLSYAENADLKIAYAADAAMT